MMTTLLLGCLGTAEISLEQCEGASPVDVFRAKVFTPLAYTPAYYSEWLSHPSAICGIYIGWDPNTFLFWDFLYFYSKHPAKATHESDSLEEWRSFCPDFCFPHLQVMAWVREGEWCEVTGCHCMIFQGHPSICNAGESARFVPFHGSSCPMIGFAGDRI